SNWVPMAIKEMPKLGLNTLPTDREV
ncbi:uncharacterized protein METZ01_LOCUS346746, partial [marine metagenome]